MIWLAWAHCSWGAGIILRLDVPDLAFTFVFGVWWSEVGGRRSEGRGCNPALSVAVSDFALCLAWRCLVLLPYLLLLLLLHPRRQKLGQRPKLKPKPKLQP